jgi:hypothetical protein
MLVFSGISGAHAQSYSIDFSINANNVAVITFDDTSDKHAYIEFFDDQFSLDEHYCINFYVTEPTFRCNPMISSTGFVDFGVSTDNSSQADWLENNCIEWSWLNSGDPHLDLCERRFY